MVLKSDQERVTTLLKDTITLLCKNGLTFKSKFSVEALIGVTLDEDDVFLVSIKELVKSDKVLAGESELEASLGDESDTTDSAVSPRSRRKRKKRKHVKSEAEESEDQGDVSGQEGENSGQGTEPKRLMLQVKEEQVEDDDDADIMFIKEELDDWSRSSQQGEAQSQQAAFYSNKFPMNSPGLSDSHNFSMLPGGSLPGQDGGLGWNSPGGVNQSMAGQYRPIPNTSGTPPTAGMGSEQSQVAAYGNRCDICGKLFTHRRNMVAHRKHHAGLFPYYCEICGKGCMSTAHLAGHVSRHPDAVVYNCSVCRRNFYSQKLYESHKSKGSCLFRASAGGHE